MQRNNGVRIFPLIITLIIVALAIAAVVSIGRALFSADSSIDSAQVDQGRETLLNTASGYSVQMTVRGPIVAEEEFESYSVTVSSSERSMNAYSGYLESKTDGKTLGNNTRAYAQFVNALDKANMMKGEQPTDEDDDSLLGVCATGYVYEFAVRSNGNTVKELWTSTCSGSKGTLDASKEQLANLFLDQVPEASELIPFKQSSVYSL